MNLYIKQFNNISIGDFQSVGGKNSYLGEMFSKLSSNGICVPDGFATTAFAYQEFLTKNSLHSGLYNLMNQLDKTNYTNLEETGLKARQLLLDATFPETLQKEILCAYKNLCGDDTYSAVAVRSSATAEDPQEANFAGLHDSYLNITGEEALIIAAKKCFASLFTNRAIKYREDNSFAHEKISLSVGIQKMVRPDKASSGACFTLEPEPGFRDVILISGVWGQHENIVQGMVTPDEFFIFKPTLIQHKNAIIQKKPGKKEKQEEFVLADGEITQLANWALVIENHFQKPMDIEWAKDGITNELFIIQARPETAHSQKNPLLVKAYASSEKGEMLTQ
ncbi:MAG: PEP/pyruvate-binding domain-containing protein [Ginsengibacter sp.]